MGKLVSMNAEGRITLPSAARKELGLEGDAQLEVAVEDDAIVLRPAVILSREDAWAYTPEHRSLLGRARRDSREGRVRRVSEHALEELGE